jgi:hypothetical protein
MKTTPDPTAAGSGGTFDPQQAAALLGQTTRQARRQLEPTPPWLLAARGLGVLAALGVIWLSVRGQHPYRGPTAADIPVLVVFIVLNFFATVGVRQRATAGVRGKTQISQLEIVVLVLAFVVTIAVMVTFGTSAASWAYHPGTVLILPALAWAALRAAKADWRSCVGGLAVVVVGVAGLFAGPAGSWAVAAVGLCAVLLARAAAIVRQRRA